MSSRCLLSYWSPLGFQWHYYITYVNIRPSACYVAWGFFWPDEESLFNISTGENSERKGLGKRL